MDELLEHFLDEVGISQVTALTGDNLALGFLHKVACGLAPKPVCDLFRVHPQNLFSYGFIGRSPAHSLQLHDPVAFDHPAIIKRSVFGLIRIYNSLPERIASAKTPQILQRGLQKLAKEAAAGNVADWPLMFHASV